MKTPRANIRLFKKKIQSVKRKFSLIFHRDKSSTVTLLCDDNDPAPIPPLSTTLVTPTNDSEELGEFTSRDPPSTTSTLCETLCEAPEKSAIIHLSLNADPKANHGVYATAELAPKLVSRPAITSAIDEVPVEPFGTDEACDTKKASAEEIPRHDCGGNGANQSGPQFPYFQNILRVNENTIIVGLSFDDLVNIGIQTVVNGNANQAGPHHFPHCPLYHQCQCFHQQWLNAPERECPIPQPQREPEKRIVSVHLEQESESFDGDGNLAASIENHDNRSVRNESKVPPYRWPMNRKIRQKGREPLKAICI